MSEDDPFQSEWWKEFSADARERLYPALKGSAVTMVMHEPGEADVKMALELGMSILLDKPIIIAVKPGARVADHIVRVADAIIEMEYTPESAERDQAAIASALDKLGLSRPA